MRCNANLPFYDTAEVAEMNQQNSAVKAALAARVNDVLSLQRLLNASRSDYNTLEKELAAARLDLALQQVWR